MENGNHPSLPNGDPKTHDAPGETKALFASRPAPATAADSSNIASLLPPELSSSDDKSDTGSRRSSLQPRIPSRQLLQTALDLAQKAVEMDKGNDVAGALAAYREAVTKLRVVMERVGVDPTDPKRTGKNEDEGRTLRGIHDAYMARITLLSAYEGAEPEDMATDGLSTLVLDSVPSVNGASISSGIPAPLLIQNTDPAANSNIDAPLRSPAASSTISNRRARNITSTQGFGLDDQGDDHLDDAEDGDDAETAVSQRSVGKSFGALDGSPRNSQEADHPLPPLPGGRTTSNVDGERLLVTNPTQGSISRRRHQGGGAMSMSSISELNGSPRGSFVDSLDSASTRNRTASMMKGLNYTNGDFNVPPVPPLQASYKSTLAPPIRLQGTAHLAPQPEPQPGEVLHRPFHLLRLLSASMDPNKPGAYITSYLHIDHNMWKPATWKTSSKSKSELRLKSQDAKARVCAALIAHLEGIRTAGAPLLDGVRGGNYGTQASTLSASEKDQAARLGDHFAGLLEAMDDELDSNYKVLQSKGVSVGAWKGKTKTSWGSRISARVDKMTRNSDNPDRYLELLSQLFAALQTIDDHLWNFTGPCTPGYQAVQPKTYKQIEGRLTRVAQFVATVIVPFVMDDLRILLMAYLKVGLKYLEE